MRRAPSRVGKWAFVRAQTNLDRERKPGIRQTTRQTTRMESYRNPHLQQAEHAAGMISQKATRISIYKQRLEKYISSILLLRCHTHLIAIAHAVNQAVVLRLLGSVWAALEERAHAFRREPPTRGDTCVKERRNTGR